MRSLVLGSLAAAVLMFVLGFVFFGILGMQAFAPLDPATAVAVQAALGETLPATGTYMVPGDEEEWMRGPGAVVNYVAAGGAPAMGAAMALGFVHFLVSALLIGLGLRIVGGDAARRAQAAIWFGLAAAVFMRLGDPIWYGFAWRFALFGFVADAVMFIAGGLVLARWFSGAERPAAPRSAAPQGVG